VTKHSEIGTDGKIKTIRGGGNQRLYNVKSFINPKIEEEEESTKTKYIYCRVSSHKQKNDLTRQINSLQEKYPNHTVVKEIASGINFKRKILNRILEESYRGLVEEIVVAHKDRLCRIAWDHFEWLFQLYGVTLIIDSDEELHHSPESELAEDLMSIVHVFSCRHYGQRGKCGKKNVSGTETEDSPEKGKSCSCSSEEK
jgi:predicted site-specific integrase-resolvase